jgi:hypothetical protein
LDSGQESVLGANFGHTSDLDGSPEGRLLGKERQHGESVVVTCSDVVVVLYLKLWLIVDLAVRGSLSLQRPSRGGLGKSQRQLSRHAAE